MALFGIGDTYDPRNLSLWQRITHPDGLMLFIYVIVFLLGFIVYEWRLLLREIRADRRARRAVSVGKSQ